MASNKVLLLILSALCIVCISVAARSVDEVAREGSSWDLKSAESTSKQKQKQDQNEASEGALKRHKVVGRETSSNRVLKTPIRNKHEDIPRHNLAPAKSNIEEQWSEPIKQCPIELCSGADEAHEPSKKIKKIKQKKKATKQKKVKPVKKVVEEEESEEDLLRKKGTDLGTLLQLHPELGNRKKGLLSAIGKKVDEGASAIEQVIGDHLGFVLPTKVEIPLDPVEPLEKLREAQDFVAEQGEQIVDEILEELKRPKASPDADKKDFPSYRTGSNNHSNLTSEKQPVAIKSLFGLIDLLAQLGLDTKILADPELPKLLSDLKTLIIEFKSSRAY